MPSETLLIILVAAVAFAFIVQTVIVYRTMRSTGDLVRRISEMSDSLEHDARDVMARMQDVGTSVEHLKSVFENLGKRTGELTRVLEGRATDLNNLIDTLVEVGNRQAGKVDSVVTDTVTKFEQTTEIIQQDILRPVVEISAILRGLKTGLGFLVNRPGARSSGESPRDDDLFI